MYSRIVPGALLCAALCLLPAPPAAAQQPRSVRHYALVLEDPAVADRFTTRESTRSVEAENYRAQVKARQASLQAELQARKFMVVGAVDTLSNAVFVATTPDRVAELESLAGVKGVIAMRSLKPHLNRATSLANAPVAWTALGGQSNAGAGIKIAVIGSGIDQTHPAFQDPTLSTPPGFPKCTTGFPADCAYTNNKVIVARSYVRELSAGSSTDATLVAKDSGPDDYSPRDRWGHETAVASVIAGNQNTGPAVAFSGMAPKAWLGNYKVDNSPGIIGGGWGAQSNGQGGANWESVYIQAINDAFNDGMHIANLSSGVIATTGPLDTGALCGKAAGVPCDFLAYNFEKAAELGMVITVSAGNDGENEYGFWNYFTPGFNLISSPANAPSVIAVGATQNSHVLQPSVSLPGGPSNLQNIQAQTSDAYSSYIGASNLPVMDAAQAGNDGYACVGLPEYALYQKIALIEQGNCDFTTKATNAANAGAYGIIFYMNAAGTVTPVETQDSNGNIPLFGPVVIISNADGQNLKSYIDAHGGLSVTVDPAGWEMDITAYDAQAAALYAPGFATALAANQLLGFSSPGPDAGDLAIKPDIVATGGSDYLDGPADFPDDSSVQDFNLVGLEAMYMAAQKFDQNGSEYSANGYIADSGTSFSAPMVAGAAALLMQLHPTYTAAQIKALLMNTAAQNTPGDIWGNNVDAIGVGAGRLDVGAATGSAVIAQVVTSNGTNPVSISFGGITQLPLSKQVLVTNLGTAQVALSVTVSAPIDVNGGPASGTTIAVDKPSFTLAGGASGTITVTLSGTLPAADEYTGAVTLSGTGVAIHVPYMFLVASGELYDMQAIQFNQTVPVYGDPSDPTCFESVVGSDAGPIGIKLVDASGVPIANSPVSFTVSPRNSATLKSVTNEPSCSPSSTTSATTCNTDSYGIAWVELFAGSSTSANPLITATAGGADGFVAYFGGLTDSQYACGVILPLPTVSSVSEAAVGSTNIAAGSYISIYGTNLANPLNVGNNTFYGGDAPGFLPYPMSLDGVTVSFDVPGAYDGNPAHYSGYPAYFTFVSQAGAQLNVQIPWELQGANSALVKVTVDGIVDSNVLTIPLAAYAPQLFQSCGGYACAIDATTYAANSTPISASNPAHAGDAVQLYGNGLGPVNNQPASGAAWSSGAYPSTKSPCTVTVGGLNAPVAYCGLSGYPAEYQINITVPSGLAAGSQPVILTTGGVSSKPANLPIR
jgi:uncharacterized protein (TIGR03437 family)